jgi:hypothetical protein
MPNPIIIDNSVDMYSNDDTIHDEFNYILLFNTN